MFQKIYQRLILNICVQDCQFHETIIEASLLKVIEEVSKCENLTMANHILHQTPVPFSSDYQERV